MVSFLKYMYYENRVTTEQLHELITNGKITQEQYNNIIETCR